MENSFQESINLTTNKNEAHETAVKISIKQDNYIYGLLCDYCADNDINLKGISVEVFQAASNVIKDYCSGNPKDFYFWIDPQNKKEA